MIPKTAEGIHTIICKFNETNEYVLYYHGGRKTLRIFRVTDGVMIANYRVSSHLSSVESTTDGKSVALGMVDGNLTVLTIADPKKLKMTDYLKHLPSRRGLLNITTNSRTNSAESGENLKIEPESNTMALCLVSTCRHCTGLNFLRHSGQ